MRKPPLASPAARLWQRPRLQGHAPRGAGAAGAPPPRAL